MPSQLLHTLFGEDVSAEIYRRLKDSLAEARFKEAAERVLDGIQNVHKKMFALGCQGPDIFYHSQGRRPVGLEYGTLLHRRGVGTLTAVLLGMSLPNMRRQGEGEGSAAGYASGYASDYALGVYALGFMTHAILDREAHPYIVYKSDRPPSEPQLERSHAFFERIIDVLMLKQLKGAEITNWDQADILGEICDSASPHLKELLYNSLIRSYPERAGKDDKLKSRIENTFSDCASFFRVTAPADTRINNPAVRAFPLEKGYIAYLYPEDLPTDIDFLNLEKRPWYYPAGGTKEDFRSFPEIYAGAVNTAAESLSAMLGRFLEEGVFPTEEAAKVIGDGGLSIVDENGKPCAFSRTEPLPLGEVLEEQATMRNL